MNHIIPASFLFQYSVAIPRIAELPRRKGSVLQLPPESAVFVPRLLNGDTNNFELRMAWNEHGVGVSLRISGRRLPVTGRSDDLKHSDHLQLMIDTRRAADVHRATAYCSSLIVLPVDEQHQGQPRAMVHDIAQQRESRHSLDATHCRLTTSIMDDGYQCEIWIPEEQLFGFKDAPEIGHIGFYCVVRDTELGEMPMSIGGDFPVTFDPSTWIQTELVR